MPRFSHRHQPATPKYRRHKATGQAVVTIQGHDHYLGPWGTKASRLEYDRLIAEWLSRGRPIHPVATKDMTIVELSAGYLRYADSYYKRKNGEPSGTAERLRPAFQTLCKYYGRTGAADFGPRALKALRLKMMEMGHSRGYINANVRRILQGFRWAASEEHISPLVVQALATVPGLHKGLCGAREASPIRAVDDAIVEATLPHLPEIVADMVRLQQLTGARPSEVCILRPCDVDTTVDVWTYRPESHKTENHDLERIIYIGPKGQDVLRKYLLRDKTSYCFIPAESERKRNEERRANRQTPMTPSQSRRRPKRKRGRPPGELYTRDSYRRAIHRACDQAGVARWSPNRLRHSAATKIRRLYGLDAAQVTLGHTSAKVSEIYAEADRTLATKVMREVG